MPYLERSTYIPPRLCRSSHLQTIAPTLLRRSPQPPYKRFRLELSDGDFIDYDVLEPVGDQATKCTTTAIISHGLEGSSSSKYVSGFTRTLSQHGVRCVAWNFRGCSGTLNRLLPWYHSGKSDDLAAVVNEVLRRYPQTEIHLVGISVGGNITLKYLGELGSQAPVARAVTISVPVDLAASAEVLARPEHRIYMRWFLRTLRERVADKTVQFPREISLEGFDAIKTFYDFDTRYTAPLHGYQTAHEYWNASSSLPVLQDIRVPTLLISACDDPFLDARCIPRAIAERSPYLYLETPQHGGHVGFIPWNVVSGRYWIEDRVREFLLGG
jgi:predicted alpha/beta-fold hydrolase